MSKNQIFITKDSGERVAYSRKNLVISLERSGAREDTINHVIREVESHLQEGMSTKDIYRYAFSVLKKIAPTNAGRYKLRLAIAELGPTGYPFEKYIGEILRHQGYIVNTGLIVQGKCVQHEVDVVAEKENRLYLVECKFHSDKNTKCDVKIPLYIKSRFDDIADKNSGSKDKNHLFHQGWLVTNTRFTADALQYGTCAGLNMISWDFPKHGSLKERIETSGLHPITCIDLLTDAEKKELLDQDIILSKHLTKEEKLLKQIGVTGDRLKKIMIEAKELSHEK